MTYQVTGPHFKFQKIAAFFTFGQPFLHGPSNPESPESHSHLLCIQLNHGPKNLDPAPVVDVRCVGGGVGKEKPPDAELENKFMLPFSTFFCFHDVGQDQVELSAGTFWEAS